jgi:hypothetical protein
VPVSKRRKQTRLSRLKNSVRGAPDKWQALKGATKAAPPNLIGQLAEWGTRSLKYDVLKSLEPTGLRDLHTGPFPKDTESFAQEFEWAVALHNAKAPLLKRFVTLKHEFEQRLLSGQRSQPLAPRRPRRRPCSKLAVRSALILSSRALAGSSFGSCGPMAAN